MATVAENELKELTDLINNRFNDLKDDIKAIDKKLDIYIAKTDERLNSIDQGLADLKRTSVRVKQQGVKPIQDKALVF